MEFTNSTATGNVLLGNLIGTQIDGLTALSNKLDGVLITNSASNNTIGGIVTGDGNTIRSNTSTGVLVASGCGELHSWEFDLLQWKPLGIDLNGDGVTKNDTGRLRQWSQHAAELSGDLIGYGGSVAVSSTSGSLTITGSLNSVANSSFSLDFYASATPNAANYGEGQTYLGSTTVTTDAQGNVATYSVTFTVAVPTGQYVTATATDQPRQHIGILAGLPAQCGQCDQRASGEHVPRIASHPREHGARVLGSEWQPDLHL